MKKEEIIRRYGEAAYEKMLEQTRERNKANYKKCKEQVRQWRKANPKKVKEMYRRWREKHPETVKTHNHELHSKGGKYYEKELEYERTGLQGERNTIRRRHRRVYHHYKNIIAPDSQVHHEWIAGTSDYRGAALVEKDQHRHGIIDVIKILKGKITLFTEEEIRDQAREHGIK